MSISLLLSHFLEPSQIKQWPHHFSKTVLTGISLDAPSHIAKYNGQASLFIYIELSTTFNSIHPPPFFSWILIHTPPNFFNTLLDTIGQVYESGFAAETIVLISQ